MSEPTPVDPYNGLPYPGGSLYNPDFDSAAFDTQPVSPPDDASDIGNEQLPAGDSLASKLGKAAVGNLFDFGDLVSSPTPDASTSPNFAPKPAPTQEEIAIAARKVLDAKLATTLLPIVDALRGEPAYSEKVEAVLQGGPMGPNGQPTRFLLSEEILSAQRPLEPWERRHLSTMVELSTANPYIMAANQAPEVTAVCLDAHFSRLGDKTREKLPDGAYTPIAVLGAGVHSTVIAGEILRKRPDLVDKTVFIERNDFPGGPFAYPNGKGWNLNSAGPQGEEPFTLPDDNTFASAAEGVRGQGGGMLRHYPGERNSSTTPNAPRKGSINRVIEYFPAPDTSSADRYVDNLQMANMIKAQAALTMGNFLNRTDLISVEDNNDGGPGLLKLNLEDVDEYGIRTARTLYVDEFWAAAGKQRPNRAFAPTQTFYDILEDQRKQPGRLPYYSNGLEPYKLLADRSKGKLEHGTRFILAGAGNTTETEAEALAGLFQAAATEGNLDVSKIEKIYIIGSEAQDKVACRRRYRQIIDLLARNGRENVLEIIDARLSTLNAIRTVDGGLDLYVNDENGDAVRNKNGSFVFADHVFDGTGFKSEMDDVFQPILDKAGKSTVEEIWTDVTLPNNPDIAVGRRIVGRPNIAFFGTVVPPKFNDAKLNQLPDTARDVLELVSENVVAIGFTTPDTQVGVGIQLEDRAAVLPPIDLDQIDASLTAGALSAANPNFQVADTFKGVDAGLNTDRFADKSSALLTPLLLGQMATHRLAAKGEVEVRAILRTNGAFRSVTNNGVLPQEVATELLRASGDDYFVAYANRAIAQRRGATAVEVVMNYRNGRLRPRASYVQPI